MLDKNKKLSRKTFKVMHFDWKRGIINYDFILLPVGALYHKGIRDAKPGDVVKFLDGTERTVYDVCEISINSALFRNLCRLRYGRETRQVFNQWIRTAMGVGFSPKSIDDEVAAVVWFKKYENHDILMNDKEIERIRKERYG